MVVLVLRLTYYGFFLCVIVGILHSSFDEFVQAEESVPERKVVRKVG